jgi:hypothetical protein
MIPTPQLDLFDNPFSFNSKKFVVNLSTINRRSLHPKGEVINHTSLVLHHLGLARKNNGVGRSTSSIGEEIGQCLANSLYHVFNWIVDNRMKAICGTLGDVNALIFRHTLAEL